MIGKPLHRGCKVPRPEIAAVAELREPLPVIENASGQGRLRESRGDAKTISESENLVDGSQHGVKVCGINPALSRDMSQSLRAAIAGNIPQGKDACPYGGVFMFARSRPGQGSPPSNEEIIARVEALAAARGLSVRDACLKAGLGSGAVYDWNRDSRPSPTLRTISKLAAVLDSSPAWLAFGDSYAAAPNSATVPVKGEVAAGLFRFVGQSDEPELPATSVPADGQYPASAQYDLVVRGTSINQIARDGDYLRCVDLQNHRASSGELVIVEQISSDGAVEATAKIIHRTSDHIELWPLSDDAKWQDPIIIPRDKKATDREVRIVARVVFVYRPIRVDAFLLKLRRLSQRLSGTGDP